MSEAAARIIGLYRRHADAWKIARERQHGARPMEAGWLDQFLKLLPSCPTVLDLGCGTGEPMGRYLADQGCDLTGVDAAPEMIAFCEARLPKAAWHVADMRSLALHQRFDGILAWDSLFHLNHADQRGMFITFRTHAARRAALMFTSGTHHGVAMGRFEDEPLYHASLDAAEYRSLLAENGFDAVANVVEDPSCGGRTIWLAQRA